MNMNDHYWKDKRILVTGGTGFVGSSLIKKLKLLKPMELRFPSRKEVDLTLYGDCLKITKGVDIVIHLAANVGNVDYLNLYPANIFDDNVLMSMNLIKASHKLGVEKFVNLGSSYIYPQNAKYPLTEDQIWNGLPYRSGMYYGLAKRSVLSQMLAYREQYGFNSIFLVPVSTYGPWDNFNKKSKKVIPSLIIKFIEAQRKQARFVKVWGTGKATRDFLYITDLVNGIILATKEYNEPFPLNLATGKNISIAKLAILLKELTNYHGKVLWDNTRSEGPLNFEVSTEMARKKINFKPEISLANGLKITIDWYLNRYPRL